PRSGGGRPRPARSALARPRAHDPRPRSAPPRGSGPPAPGPRSGSSSSLERRTVREVYVETPGTRARRGSWRGNCSPAVTTSLTVGVRPLRGLTPAGGVGHRGCPHVILGGRPVRVESRGTLRRYPGAAVPRRPRYRLAPH